MSKVFRIDALCIDIFAHLPDQDIYNLRSVSHQFNSISSHSNLLWQEIYIRDKKDPSAIESNIREPLFTQSKKRQKMFLDQVLNSPVDSILIEAIQAFKQTMPYKLLEITNQIRTPHRRILARIDIGMQLLRTDPETANQLFDEALKSVDQIGNDCKDEIRCELVKAKAQTETQEADKIAHQIDAISPRARAFIDIGNALMPSDPEKADTYYNKAYELAYQHKAVLKKLIFAKVRKHPQEADKIARQMGTIYLRILSFIEIGNALTLSNPKEADKYFNEAYELVDKANTPLLKNNILLNLAKGKAQIHHLQEAYEIARQINDRLNKALFFIDLGEMPNAPADKLFNEAFELFDQLRDLEKVCVLRALIKVKAPTCPKEAEKMVRQIVRHNDDPIPTALAFIDIGKAQTSRNPKEAAKYFNEALTRLSQIRDNHYGRGKVLLEFSQSFIDGSVFSS